jgi:hypothetical protein
MWAYASSAQSCLLWTVDVLESATDWREVGAPVKSFISGLEIQGGLRVMEEGPQTLGSFPGGWLDVSDVQSQ